MEKIQKTEQEWRQELDPAAYEVLRHQATERPWTGRYVNEKGHRVFRCAGGGNGLFNSDTKFQPGRGRPDLPDPLFREAGRDPHGPPPRQGPPRGTRRGGGGA